MICSCLLRHGLRYNTHMWQRRIPHIFRSQRHNRDPDLHSQRSLGPVSDSELRVKSSLREWLLPWQ